MWNTDCIYDSGCKGKVKKIQMAEKNTSTTEWNYTIESQNARHSTETVNGGWVASAVLNTQFDFQQRLLTMLMFFCGQDHKYLINKNTFQWHVFFFLQTMTKQ